MSNEQPTGDLNILLPDEKPHGSQIVQPNGHAYVSGRDFHIHLEKEQPTTPATESEWWLYDIRQKMRNDCVYDVLRPSLENFLKEEPTLAEQPDAVSGLSNSNQPQEWGESSPLPEKTLIGLFDGRAYRRLLVLGEPGAGKSTALLRLAKSLLDRGDSNPDAPVPVVLQLSAWDGAKDALRWIADQVSSRYRVPADEVEPWLTDGRLVLLLDGLDEITDVAQQRNCVAALSALRKEKPAGMVVCCRTKDYRRIGERLEFGLAVIVRDLTQDQLVRYLARDSTLAPLRRAVSDNPELAKLLDTPLMLSMAIRTCPDGIPGKDILTGNHGERLDRLWDRHVTAMLIRRRDPYPEFPSKRRHLPERAAYQHLVRLAYLMKHWGLVEFYPDWFGSRWLPDRRSLEPVRAGRVRRLGTLLGWQRASTLCVSLTFALVIAVPLGLAYGFTGDSGGTTASRLIYGLVYGITGGLIGGSCYGLSEGLASVRKLGGKWRRFGPAARYALGGFSCGLTYGLAWKTAATGLFGQPHLLVTEGLPQALVSGLIDGVFCGLAVRLIGGVSAAENSRAIWRWSWRDAGYGMLGGLCSGIVYGLVYGAGSGQLTGPPGALAAGLVSALGLGVICGWQPDPRGAPTRPGQALWRTLRTYGIRIVASLAGAVVISAVVIASAPALLPATHQNFANAIPAIFATGLSALVLGVVFKGLVPLIDHHVARFIATWNGFLPRDLVGFLDYCEERIILRRSGGYYSFLHRSLSDHLATRDPWDP
ncbi:MAG: NACHT domain-containing protein [Nocardiopsaceae bacterium]|nr:NACHT domain-containing protein [Nocardiopsaceae bacterium]